MCHYPVASKPVQELELQPVHIQTVGRQAGCKVFPPACVRPTQVVLGSCQAPKITGKNMYLSSLNPSNNYSPSNIEFNVKTNSCTISPKCLNIQIIVSNIWHTCTKYIMKKWNFKQWKEQSYKIAPATVALDCFRSGHWERDEEVVAFGNSVDIKLTSLRF